MTSPNPRISTLYLVTLVCIAVIGCGSPGTLVDEKTSLDKAIVYFIDGDLEKAEILFNQVISESKSDEDLETAYLYLGRIFLARDEYQKAADALSTGMTIGGDVRFEEYFELASKHLVSSTRRIPQEEQITRAQMAALIDDVFARKLEENVDEQTWPLANNSATKNNQKTHWASEYIAKVEAAGIMRSLPDGDFHPDDFVSWPSFFIVNCRLVDSLGLSRSIIDEMFERGFRGTVEAQYPNEDTSVYVTGQDAVFTLEKLARVAGL